MSELWHLAYERHCLAMGIHAWRVRLTVAHLTEAAGYVEADSEAEALQEAVNNFGHRVPIFGGQFTVERVVEEEGEVGRQAEKQPD